MQSTAKEEHDILNHLVKSMTIQCEPNPQNQQKGNMTIKLRSKTMNFINVVATVVIGFAIVQYNCKCTADAKPTGSKDFIPEDCLKSYIVISDLDSTKILITLIDPYKGILQNTNDFNSVLEKTKDFEDLLNDKDEEGRGEYITEQCMSFKVTNKYLSAESFDYKQINLELKRHDRTICILPSSSANTQTRLSDDITKTLDKECQYQH